MQERGAGARPWSRLDMASCGGSRRSPFVPPLPVIPGGMDSTFVGGTGSGSSQTHGADVPSTAPTVVLQLFTESVHDHRAHPRAWALQLVCKPLTTNHAYAQSSANRVQSSFGTTSTTTLPLARVRTHSVSATTGAGQGYVGTDDGHSVFADSLFESESSLHWQDEPALTEAESRPTSMDAAPVHGYGVGSNNEYGVSNSRSESNANDGRASPVYGVKYAGYVRGARGSAMYDPDSVYDARGSTLLAYDRDSAYVYEPRR